MFFKDKESFSGYYGRGLWVLFLLQTYVSQEIYVNIEIVICPLMETQAESYVSRLVVYFTCVCYSITTLCKQNVHIFVRILADNDSLQHAAINGNLDLW